MPTPYVPGDSRVSRELRDALSAALHDHHEATNSLRDAVCAYYDTLVTDGTTPEQIRQSLTDLMAKLDGSAQTTAKRSQLLDAMLAWCTDRS